MFNMGGDCGVEEEDDKARLFSIVEVLFWFFLFSLLSLLITWLRTILIGGTVLLEEI